MKPMFFKDEDLADHPPLTRILFQGLWCLADKEGRLEDRPRYIKVEVLPYDQCDIPKMLQKLHDSGFIQRYKINGNGYIQIHKFTEHQRITGKEAETESKIPPILDGETIEKQRGNNGETIETTGREGKGREGKGRERKGKEGKGKESVEIPEELKQNKTEILDWLEYKREKGQAYKPRGLEALWRVLSKIPEASRKETIEKSMANNWQGIFADLKITAQGNLKKLAQLSPALKAME